MNKKHIKKRCLYSQTTLANAIAEIKTGKPVSNVSKKYNIPRSTLLNKKKGTYANKKPGPATVLTSEEESDIVKWILNASSRGFPVTKDTLLNSIQLMLNQQKRVTLFTDNRPGRHWFESFLRRHNILSKRMTENLSLSRAVVSEEALRGWFSQIENYLREKDLLNIESSRIFNCDETALQLNVKIKSVLTKKGEKNVYNVVNNNEKENLTVLITGNAAGQLAPPTVVFSYKRTPELIIDSMPNNWGIGHSDSGWMTGATFYEHIANIFHPWLVNNHIKRPVVLYFDGHASHMTKPLSDFCLENEIELIALYPNATHILQPMDVALFYPLKAVWRKEVVKYRLENDALSVKKKDFGPLLKVALEKLDIVKILQNGFRTCGLFPLNVEEINFEKIPKKRQTCAEESLIENKKSESLKLIEDVIGVDTIEEFKKVQELDEWNGNIEHKSLFLVWKKLLTLSKMVESNASSPTVQEEQHVLETININFDEDTIICDLEDENIIAPIANSNMFEDNKEEDNFQISPIQVITISNDCSNSNTIQCSTNKDISLFEENQSSHQPLKDITHLQEINTSTPFSFKQYSFWPRKDITTSSSGKHKEQLPSIVTSNMWRNLMNEKEEKKRKLEEEKEMRKKIKINNIVIKKEKVESAKAKREEEKAAKAKKEEEKKVAKAKREEERKAAKAKKEEEKKAAKVKREEEKKAAQTKKQEKKIANRKV